MSRKEYWEEYLTPRDHAREVWEWFRAMCGRRYRVSLSRMEHVFTFYCAAQDEEEAVERLREEVPEEILRYYEGETPQVLDLDKPPKHLPEDLVQRLRDRWLDGDWSNS